MLLNENQLDRKSVRALLAKLISSEFDGFILDNWPDVHRIFTNSMDRIGRENVLLEKVPSEEIINRMLIYLTNEPELRAPDMVHSASPLADYSVASATIWIIKASLYLLGSCLVFFFLAPSVNYPLQFTHSLRMLEIIVPVFLCYICQLFYATMSSKTHKSFQKSISPAHFNLLIKTPLLIVGIALFTVLLSFGISNSRWAETGGGITPDGLALSMAVLVTVLVTISGAIVAFLIREQ